MISDSGFNRRVVIFAAMVARKYRTHRFTSARSLTVTFSKLPWRRLTSAAMSDRGIPASHCNEPMPLW